MITDFEKIVNDKVKILQKEISDLRKEKEILTLAKMNKKFVFLNKNPTKEFLKYINADLEEISLIGKINNLNNHSVFILKFQNTSRFRVKTSSLSKEVLDTLLLKLT